jgi:RHS repeat-associated protein
LTYTYTVYYGGNAYLDVSDTTILSGAGTPLISHRYIYGTAVDQILATDNMSGTVRWGLGDNMGTARDVVSNSGSLVTHVQFDSAGKPLSAMAADFLFGQAGMRYDATTGEYRTFARVYDPKVGRPLSQDPLGLTPDSNPYRWCGNNSVVHADPSGLWSRGPNVFDDGTLDDLQNFLYGLIDLKGIPTFYHYEGQITWCQTCGYLLWGHWPDDNGYSDGSELAGKPIGWDLNVLRNGNASNHPFLRGIGKGALGLGIGAAVGTPIIVGVAFIPVVGPFAALGLLMAGSLYGGYATGQQIWQAGTGEELAWYGAQTGRTLTSDQRWELGGELTVNMTAMGVLAGDAAYGRVTGEIGPSVSETLAAMQQRNANFWNSEPTPATEPNFPIGSNDILRSDPGGLPGGGEPNGPYVPEPSAPAANGSTALVPGVVPELRLNPADFTAAERAAIEFKYSVANGRIAVGAETSEVGSQVPYNSYLSRRFVRDALQPGAPVKDVRVPSGFQVDEFVSRQYGGRQVPENQWLIPNENNLNQRLGPLEKAATQHLPDGTPIRGWQLIWEGE